MGGYPHACRRSVNRRDLGEKCLQGRDQPGYGLGRCLPDDGAVHLGIPVDGHIPGRDDLVDVGNALGKLGGGLSEVVESLTD